MSINSLKNTNSGNNTALYTLGNIAIGIPTSKANGSQEHGIEEAPYAVYERAPQASTGNRALAVALEDAVTRLLKARTPNASERYSFSPPAAFAALDFGLPTNSERLASEWRQACERLTDIYKRQARKSFLLIADLLARASRDEDATEEVSSRLTNLIALLGEPALWSTAAHMENFKGTDSYEILARALARTADADTTRIRFELLSRGTESRDPQTRYAAVAALGELDQPDARSKLAHVADTDENRDVRILASRLLK